MTQPPLTQQVETQMEWTGEPLPVERIEYREIRPGQDALIIETPYGTFSFELPKAKAERLARKLIGS